MHLDLAGVITTETRFHASEIFPEQHFFSHVTIFRRKNVLAGISRRPKIPERALIGPLSNPLLVPSLLASLYCLPFAVNAIPKAFEWPPGVSG